MTRTWITILPTIALLSSCGGAGDGGFLSGLKSDSSLVINGSPPDAEHHQAVVALFQRDGYDILAPVHCSGTLIRKDVVLTAAHCLDDRTLYNFVVYLGDDPHTDWFPRFINPADFEMHPDYDDESSDYDVGLIRLAEPVDDIQPIPPLSEAMGFVPQDEDQLTLNFAGFGDDELGNSDVKLQVDGQLDFILSDVKIWYDQDENGPCFGDSGGPAFVERDGKTYVGATTSYGDEDCDIYGVSARVDAVEAFISGFAGDSPIQQGDPDPGFSDLCEENDWYDDGECDDFCPEPDPDCDDSTDDADDDGCCPV